MAHLDTLLLLALPASGKSEIRRYLAHIDERTAADEFHLGPQVQLDDYPYVQLMRVVSAAVAGAGGPLVFFSTPNGRLSEPRDWGMLARLLAEDYGRLGTPQPPPDRPTRHLLSRFDRARQAVGAPPVTAEIPTRLLEAIERQLDEEVAEFLDALAAELGRYGPSSTVVVEFARGGPEGATMPLAPPHGYAYTLPHLGAQMLARAAVLYVWVTPEESRRRNTERAGPGPHEEASVLHHRVPDVVMRRDYGTDDLPWLAERGETTIEVAAGSDTHRLPVEIFDNRADFTSFLRKDPHEWPADAVDRVHAELRSALGRLAARVERPG
jgi:hypothetical protein